MPSSPRTPPEFGSRRFANPPRHEKPERVLGTRGPRARERAKQEVDPLRGPNVPDRSHPHHVVSRTARFAGMKALGIDTVGNGVRLLLIQPLVLHRPPTRCLGNREHAMGERVDRAIHPGVGRFLHPGRAPGGHDPRNAGPPTRQRRHDVGAVPERLNDRGALPAEIAGERAYAAEPVGGPDPLQREVVDGHAGRLQIRAQRSCVEEAGHAGIESPPIQSGREGDEGALRTPPVERPDDVADDGWRLHPLLILDRPRAVNETAGGAPAGSAQGLAALRPVGALELSPL